MAQIFLDPTRIAIQTCVRVYLENNHNPVLAVVFQFSANAYINKSIKICGTVVSVGCKCKHLSRMSMMLWLGKCRDGGVCDMQRWGCV